MPRLSVLLLVACLAAPAGADPLPDMAGLWRGSGWARQTIDGPKEAMRCRLDNRYETDHRRLFIRGECAVPGRRLQIDGMLKADDQGQVRGVWTNPEGLGQTSVSGHIAGDAVSFTLRTSVPENGQEILQLVTWSLGADGMSLRSVSSPERKAMSAIDFAR